MELFCPNCLDYQNIQVQISGPHKKAVCTKCKKYIKFLSKENMKELEKEEDSNDFPYS